ncbi:signal transduction histidine kinase [Dongia mobilis]|uniref:histidine kinase n=1 Tax=Dongia mobilis TaxID=578943 RepID=A0A4R6WFH6_9PROT|nr:sensor histidine kinase [Dongia mobilis]TDQ78816.1 signal transduction histidine kinase [Dongia mobilis]
MRAFWSVRTVLLIALPLLVGMAALAIIGGGLVIAQRGADAAAQSLMRSATSHIVSRAVAFLSQAERLSDLTARMISERTLDATDRQVLQRYLWQQLMAHPYLAGMYVGYEDGGFTYVMRVQTVTGDQFMFKTIEEQRRARMVTVTWRNAFYEEIVPDATMVDGYDPRLRPWYAAATRGLNSGWTEPYVFWTTRQPGITVARPAKCENEVMQCVIGADITLNEMSQFFQRLESEISGRAFLLTDEAGIIAASELARQPTSRQIVRPIGQALMTVDDLDQSLLPAVWRHGMSPGALKPVGFRTLDWQGVNYLAELSAFDFRGLSWLVGIAVPRAGPLGWFSSVRDSVFWMVAGIALVTVLAAIALSQPIVAGLRRLEHNASRVRSGQFEDLLPAQGSFKEIRQTEEALIDMARNLSAQIQATQLALDEAIRAGQIKSEFLAHMSHELRTPLNGIIGFSEMIEMTSADRLGERERSYVADIIGLGRHLQQLIDQVLEFARFDHGLDSGGRDPQVLGDVVAGIRRMLEQQFAEKRLQWQVEIPDDLVLLVDETPLKQILTNLLSNAVKYTRPNGTITVRGQLRSDGTCRIEIGDNGVGMTAEELRNAFVPFSRSVRNPYVAGNSGVGLGLPITRMLCDRVGFALEITSMVDLGTTATLLVAAGRAGTRSTAPA